MINNTEEVEKWELIPWYKLKQLMFNIYEHRIDNAQELNGSVNSAYCPMNEHIIIYFMDLLGKRQLVEEKIVELIINVISFYNQWPRAKMMAANLQIINCKTGPEKEHIIGLKKDMTPDEHGDTKLDKSGFSPHGMTGDDDVIENDMYCQEYFLHCFACLN